MSSTSGPPELVPVRTFVKENEWFHTIVGIFGNVSFVLGSIFFLFPELERAGVWLFIAGSSGMLLGSVGRAIERLNRKLEGARGTRRRGRV